jgi:glutathione S-transferase
MQERQDAMLTIWGRATSSNVQKVLWCCDELGLAFERIDAGREFGKTDEPSYLALNPNGLVPTLCDGAVVIWESNAILRYLCNRYGGERLYPAEPAARAMVDQWLDWQLSVLLPSMSPLFWGLVRTAPEKRDHAAIAAGAEKSAAAWTLLDRRLGSSPYVAASQLSIADLALGNSIRRWYSFDLPRPDLPALAAWYQRLGERPGFRTHVMTPVV